MKNNKFNWKGWVSLVTILSFIIDTLSGIILYIAPPGRIANWTNWTISGLTKDQWTAIHTIFGYVLLIIICFHLYYNWKIFWNYIWSKIKRALNLKREMLFAVVICFLISIGTLLNVPPFSSTMQLGEYFKEGWEESEAETPVAHAELLTLDEFSKIIQAPVDKILKALEAEGYRVVNTQQTLGELAELNNTSPNILYEAIKSGGAEPSVPIMGEGSGMGQKKLQAFCDEMNFPIDDVIARLEKKGLNPKPEDKIKDLAKQLNVTPMEFYEFIKAD